MGGILLILALVGVYIVVYWLIAVDQRKEDVFTGLLAMRRMTDDDMATRQERKKFRAFRDRGPRKPPQGGRPPATPRAKRH